MEEPQPEHCEARQEDPQECQGEGEWRHLNGVRRGLASIMNEPTHRKVGQNYRTLKIAQNYPKRKLARTKIGRKGNAKLHVSTKIGNTRNSMNHEHVCLA